VKKIGVSNGNAIELQWNKPKRTMFSGSKEAREI
jgi:hypothetical protein